MSTTSSTKFSNESANQEEIFKHIYIELKRRVERLQIYLSSHELNGKDFELKLRVDDVRQCDLDVGGKKIIIDELFYDPPSYYRFLFSISVSSMSYENALEAYGYVARDFKDNRAVDISGVNWHLNPNDTLYFVPVVLDFDDVAKKITLEKNPVFVLYYELRLGLNSRNSSSFARTKEPAKVTGKVLK